MKSLDLCRLLVRSLSLDGGHSSIYYRQTDVRHIWAVILGSICLNARFLLDAITLTWRWTLIYLFLIDGCTSYLGGYFRIDMPGRMPLAWCFHRPILAWGWDVIGRFRIEGRHSWKCLGGIFLSWRHPECRHASVTPLINSELRVDILVSSRYIRRAPIGHFRGEGGRN